MGEPEDRGEGGRVAASLCSHFPPAVLSGLLLAAGFAVLALTTLDFPRDSRGYPLVVLTTATVLFAAVAVQNWRAGNLEPVEEPSSRWDTRVAVFVAIWVLYPVALMAIGFLVSTVVALSGSLVLLRVKRPLVWVTGVVPASFILFALLQVLLSIALPQAPLDMIVADFLYRLRG